MPPSRRQYTNQVHACICDVQTVDVSALGRKSAEYFGSADNGSIAHEKLKIQTDVNPSHLIYLARISF